MGERNYKGVLLGELSQEKAENLYLILKQFSKNGLDLVSEKNLAKKENGDIPYWPALYPKDIKFGFSYLENNNDLDFNLGLGIGSLVFWKKPVFLRVNEEVRPRLVKISANPLIYISDTKRKESLTKEINVFSKVVYDLDQMNSLPDILNVGDFMLNKKIKRVFYQGIPLNFTAIDYIITKELLENAGTTYFYQDLINTVKSETGKTEYNKFALKSSIQRLRKKLDLLGTVGKNILISNNQGVIFSNPSEEVIELYGLKVDSSGRTVEADGKKVDCSKNEFELLYTILKGRGEMVSTPYIVMKIWGGEQDFHKDVLRQTLYRLRRKLGPKGKVIETLKGEIGYKITP